MSPIGIGYDSHRLVEDRELLLGGVRLSSERGLEGHSDADVLAHAVTDAILGAAGLGDIGMHFPDTDEHYRGADSMQLLAQALIQIRAQGFRVENVDCTVLMERPKLGPHREAIAASLATVLDMPRRSVNVKASTGEGIGFVGREEGVAALAVASLAWAEPRAEPQAG